MFKLFGFRESGKRPAQPAAYAEALLAGWVPPLPEVQVRIGHIERAVEETSDIAAFLARVYRHQQC